MRSFKSPIFFFMLIMEDEFFLAIFLPSAEVKGKHPSLYIQYIQSCEKESIPLLTLRFYVCLYVYISKII